MDGPLIPPTPLIPPKPKPEDAAGTARWLVAQNIWGALSTISIEYAGAPFGHAVSFSDGLPNQGTGIPYFYLTALDPTVEDAMKDPRVSFAVTEYSLGTCGGKDPENPSCAKLTLIGKLLLVDKESEEAKFAKSALFSMHPEMKEWPESHGFQVYKLEIENIFLIDWFGGAKHPTVEEYLNYKV